MVFRTIQPKYGVKRANDVRDIRLYVGPVSRNTIEAVAEFKEETNAPIGFTATTNQIDYSNCYTGLSIDDLRSMTNDNLIYCRDHHSQMPSQDDMNKFDIIHIDPWQNNFFEAVEQTNQWTPDFIGFYEVGTEESIYDYDEKELNNFLERIDKRNVMYVVVQSGAKLQNGKNAGTYNETKLKRTIKVCKSHGLLSKEHNGDFLSLKDIRLKFELGLDAMNIAPEFGTIESGVIYKYLKDSSKVKFYDLCIKSMAWKKWVSHNFDLKDTSPFVSICGHYVFNTDEFKELKSELPDVDGKVKDVMKERLTDIFRVINEVKGI